MARGIVVEHDGLETRFDFEVVSRAKLYGERKKVVVDERGEPTVGGWLVIESSMLLGPGGRAELYLDERGDIVDRTDLAAIDSEGRLLEKLPSTLDVPQPLTPIDPEALLEVVTNNAYLLTLDTTLDGDLLAALDRGEVFKTSFAYMPGYSRSTLFLLKNDEGIFALVTEPAPLEPLGREVPPSLPEDPDDEDNGDLDFQSL